MAAEPHHVGDCSDEVDSVDEEETMELVRLNLLPSPAVQRKIKALKKLQLQATHIEANFCKEVHALECKYRKRYLPLYQKRSSIVSGEYEPNDEECQWASDSDEDEHIKKKAKVEERIPEFWLTIFKNVRLLSEMVEEHDEPILKHLSDIKVHLIEEPMGFVLEFHFEPNEYFTNTVLTKEYDMKCVPDEDDPLSFDGPEIYRCRGCLINWNKGKNVTLKTVKKNQKHKSRGLVRTMPKTVQNDSFFNFFTPAAFLDDVNGAEGDDETRNLLTPDFEIGRYIRERIVPRAVLYYTGEGVEDEDDEEEKDDEDEDSDEMEGRNPKPVGQNCKKR